jgi:regulator of cell morphogenesis and NO signaling
MQTQTQTNNGYLELKNFLLRDIVTKNFHTAEVFEKYGLDFCCNGNRPLSEACEKKGINPDTVVNEVGEILTSESTDNNHYNEWELDFLVQYIINNHHAYVRKAIPQIQAHCKKVATVHGDNHPHMKKVKELFDEVAEEMQSHMQKEETILFKIIRYLVDSQRFNEKPKTGGFGSVKNPIDAMESEHDMAGGKMEQIRDLTNNYTLPEDACSTFALTYKQLDEFEKDLHKHVHLENNILFPKSIKLEEELLKK